MANHNNPNPKPIQKPADVEPVSKAAEPPEASGKSYKVIFSGISDKTGNLRLQGETVTADELPDPDFQLRVGAIAEVIETAEPAKDETK